MGNTLSPSSGDDTSKLTTSTMLSFKQFHVFAKFPTDWSKVDEIISNKVTNALKYVNSNFINRLGGHMKRKRDPSPLVLSTLKQRL